MKTLRVSLVLTIGIVANIAIVQLVQSSNSNASTASFGDVVINEVAWSGTAASANAEWIELKNITDDPIDLTGWTLRADDGTPNITLSGVITVNGYFLLERSNDSVITDVLADLIYTGALGNISETLRLRDSLSNTIDTVNADGGAWPAGTSTTRLSMERIYETAPGDDSNWASNNGITRNGLDANGAPINGTPKQPNSAARILQVPAAMGSILISAVHYDAYNNGDESFRLTNVSTQAITLTNWFVTDGEQTLNLTGTLPAGQSIWLARNAITFSLQFGFAPDYEYNIDSDPFVPNLSGSVPALANDDELAIYEGTFNWIDAVVWGNGVISDTGWFTGWIGLSVQRYSSTSIPASRQIIYRKLDESSGAFVVDSDRAIDWANDKSDASTHRRPMYPGWDLQQFWQPAHITASARLTVAIAPDNAYAVLNQYLRSARQSIKLEVHSFENLQLLRALTETIQTHGVSVTVLLEGGPVGGIDDQELWICRQLELFGGKCWFMVNDSTAKIDDRYSYMHAKMIIVDNKVVAIGSENFSPRSMPYDDKSDGTIGQRGVYLITDAPAVVTRALAIWNADFDPAHHRDIFPWTSTDPKYGNPPIGFTAVYTTGGTGYTVRYPNLLSVKTTLQFELITSPESSLRWSDAVLYRITRCNSGERIDVEQLDEPPHWGASASNPIADPNLRLEALIAAASHGCKVRILLDGYFDDPTSLTSNAATVVYIESLRALSSTLKNNLEARLGNPTEGGIHNKMYLFDVDSHKVVHVGSINGSELSNKGNREIALQVESTAAYDYLRAMFEYDWSYRPRAYMPMLLRNPEPPVEHLLISKVFYLGTPYVDEWIQIYNPTALTVTLSSYKIGDEEAQGGAGFGVDGMWQFPPGAKIGPAQKINIAGTFSGFYNRFGYDPNFAFFDGVPGVTRMAPYIAWTTAITFSLANSGDELLLLGPTDQLVDGVAWGTGSLPGNVVCAAIVPPPYASLERTPIDKDSDNCPIDFMSNPSPLP